MGTRLVSPAGAAAEAGEVTYQRVATSRAIVTELERLFAEGVRQVALVVITLTFVRTGELGKEAEQVAQRLLTAMRSLVRRSDRVFLLARSGYFVLIGADEHGLEVVQERLWWAICSRIRSMEAAELRGLRAVSLGGSVCSGEAGAALDLAALVRDASVARRMFNCLAEAEEGAVREAPAVYAIDAALHGAAGQDEREDLSALARRLGLPYLSPLPRRVPQSVLQLVDPRLAQELRCLPVGRERNMLTVAVADPDHLPALERLQRETGLHIFPVLTPPQELQLALERLV